MPDLPQVPVADPAAPAVPGAPVSPPGSLAASVAPPGSAVPPVDPVAPQTTPTGAPAVDPSQPAADPPPAAEPPTPDFIPRAVHEEQFRSLQSAKDKEIADLTKQVQGFQAQPAQPAAPTGQPTPEEFSNENFFKQLDTDPKGAMAYLTQHVEQSVLSKVQTQQQAHQQQQDAYSQYVSAFGKATVGYTPEELQRAEVAVQQSFSRGENIAPVEAAMIGRFGSVENAMNYAHTHMATLQPDPNAQPATPPVVPGGNPVPTPSPQGAPSQDGPGSWQKMFAD